MRTSSHVAIIAGAVALALVVFLLIERIPPDAMTRTRIGIVEERLRRYWAKHGALPTDLSELPELRKDRDSSTLDGWGRPIGYEVQRTDNGVRVLLSSLGRDGRLGGSGQDADIVAAFEVGPLPMQSPAP
jgi:hypothetical protein